MSSITEDVRKALRLVSADFDDEIDDLIAAAIGELRTSGVSVAALTADSLAALIKQAVSLYCKATFGLDNPDSEKYMASFHLLASKLALCTEYRQPTTTGISGTIAVLEDELTVDDTTAITEDDFLIVAGAGASGADLVAQVTAIDALVVTLDRLASTAVTNTAVTVL